MGPPSIPANSSIPSSNDSVMSAPTDALEVSIARDGVFNEHSVIVQVDSNISASTSQRSVPASPQRSVTATNANAASPASVRRSVGGTGPARVSTTANSALHDDRNPFEATPPKPTAAGVLQQGNPFDSPTIKYEDSVFRAYDNKPSTTAQQPAALSNPPIVPQPAPGSAAYGSQQQNRRQQAADTFDDQETVGSSVTGAEMNGAQPPATSTFGRDVKGSTRMTSIVRSGTLEEDDIPEGVLICGYLQKLGRNGKWQTRWFETDGECLSYYKSNNRTKLLATLDLTKVGSISVSREDPTGCSLNINIAERPYRLRADGKITCMDWVITLNRVKEARMQEGNVKLVMPTKKQHHQQPPDLLADSFTPRVVVVANRERTRAVDDMYSWEQAMQEQTNNPAADDYYSDSSRPPGHLGSWQKPRTSMTRIARKVLKWARSLGKMGGCADAPSQVVLDHHLHPPGHDDNPSKRPSSSYAPEGKSKKDTAHAAWIGKESTASTRMGQSIPPQKDATKSMSDSVTTGANSEDGGDREPRELS